MKRLLVLALVVLAVVFPAYGFDSFVVKDIRVEGLQRIAPGTVFNYFPVKVGDTFDVKTSEKAISALFKSGFFKNIQVGRDGDVLVIAVEERPGIASIQLKGNDDIETKPLLKSLKDIGFYEGAVFNRSLLEKVEQELQRQYYSRGKYGVRIDTTVTPMERNRVGILLDVSEGAVAKIREINIVGNKVFDDKTLLHQMALGTSGFWSFYTKNDQYSRQKLAADLETLRSYYQDRGYLKFNVESTQVSITPDKKDIYITINVAEGEQYKVKEVKLSGDLVLKPEELFKDVQISAGEVFSRKRVTDTVEKISKRLGGVGFAFANVNTVPDIDEKTREVSLTFYVDPGKRVYVRRINYAGNDKTRDIVLRQEMRQFEGGWYSGDKVERSRTRLQRLGFFEDVNVETPAVPGTSDQVDINYSVTEQPSGSLSLGVGYSQTDGFLVNASISQQNFLGTGKAVSLAVDNSKVNRTYSFSYTNPYYTIDGISRGFSLYSRSTDASQANITNYTTDDFGGTVTYGIPVNEFDSIRFGIGADYLKLKPASLPSAEILDFVDQYGKRFASAALTANWSHDTRDKVVFPTKGGLTSIGMETKIPGSDLEYYKLNFRQTSYFPLTRLLVMSLNGEVGYGDGYGNFSSLPFFENFYAGGVRSVRGFEDNTLGPVDSHGDPLGGSFRTVGNMELIFPPPFASDTNAVRLALFFDAGNVFTGVRQFATSDLRSSVGLAATWLSPVGPLAISIAKPLNDKPSDKTQFFQFTLGVPF